MALALWFGSVHQLAMVRGSLWSIAHYWPRQSFVYALYDLCDHPEYIDQLRMELRQADGESRNYLDGLPFLDSFLKESARLHPSDSGPYFPSSPSPLWLITFCQCRFAGRCFIPIDLATEVAYPLGAGLVFLNKLSFAIQTTTAPRLPLKGFALPRVQLGRRAVALSPRLTPDSLFGGWGSVHGEFPRVLSACSQAWFSPTRSDGWHDCTTTLQPRSILRRCSAENDGWACGGHVWHRGHRTWWGQNILVAVCNYSPLKRQGFISAEGVQRVQGGMNYRSWGNARPMKERWRSDEGAFGGCGESMTGKRRVKGHVGGVITRIEP